MSIGQMVVEGEFRNEGRTETMEGIHDQEGKSQTSCESQRDQGERPVSNAGERSALLEELFKFLTRKIKDAQIMRIRATKSRPFYLNLT